MFSDELKGDSLLHKYKAIVNDVEYEFEHPEVTASEILIKAGKEPIECYSVYQKLEGCDFELVSNGDRIDLRQLGIERFQVLIMSLKQLIASI